MVKCRTFVPMYYLISIVRTFAECPNLSPDSYVAFMRCSCGAEFQMKINAENFFDLTLHSKANHRTTLTHVFTF